MSARSLNTQVYAFRRPDGWIVVKIPANNSSLRGATIFEILIVTSIILLIAALFFGVVISARDRGRNADSISRLHQLGLASLLYQEQSGKIPGSCLSLVTVSGLDPSLCVLASDRTVEGIGQLCAREMIRPAPPLSPHRYSYFGFYDAGMSQKAYSEFVESGSNPGWLVDLTPSKPVFGEDQCMYKGAYLRLTVEGSVLRRQHIFKEVHGKIYHRSSGWFADFPDSWYLK